MNRLFQPPLPVASLVFASDRVIGRFVLLVDVPDAERAALNECIDTRSGKDYLLRHASGTDAVREALESCSWDAVVLDCRRSDADFDAYRGMIRHYWPRSQIIVRGGEAGSGCIRVEQMAPVADSGHEALAEMLLALPRAVPEHEAPARDGLVPSDGAEHLQQLADNIPECLWLYDLAARQVVYVNSAYTAITGYPVDLSSADWRALFHCVHIDDVVRLSEAQARAPFGGLDEEFRIGHADGQVRWVQLRTFAIRDHRGLVVGVGGALRDISSLVEQKLQLYKVTNFDGLTALPNRMLLQERLAASLAMAKRNGWLLGLLLIDIDRFKIVNDTLGHGTGDELLRHAALRLRVCLRESDTIARMGGDEFAVVLPDMDNAEMAAVVARKIVDVIAEPFVINGQQLFVSASVGVSLYPDDADDLDTLVRNADTALYRAKDGGRNSYAFYTPEMNARARRRLGLETDVRQALLRGEFELYYQPKVNCRSGRITGLEALIRWSHPLRGMVGPNEFIPLLEETGIIVPVGEWVLQTACSQLKAWHDAGHDTLDVAVNVSARQMEGRRLIDAVHSALDGSGLPATALELELTESLLMRDPPAVADMLGELKAMGVQIAVDDFGTGYSSLSYLKRFPLDNLKVDRAFVQDIAASAGDASITRAVIHMGHELALKVVAEGVETADQLAALQASGCDEIQGYYFSRPLPAAEISSMLAGGWCLPVAEASAGMSAPVIDAATAKAMAELRAERDRLALAAEAGHCLWRKTLDACEDPIVGVDSDNQLVFLNAAAEAEFAGQGVAPGMPLAACLPTLADALRADPTRMKFAVRIGNEELGVRVSPLRVPGQAGGTLLWFRRPEGLR